MRRATPLTMHYVIAQHCFSSLTPCCLGKPLGSGLANTTNVQAAADTQALTKSPAPSHGRAMSRIASRGPHRRGHLSRASVSQLGHARSHRAGSGALTRSRAARRRRPRSPRPGSRSPASGPCRSPCSAPWPPCCAPSLCAPCPLSSPAACAPARDCILHEHLFTVALLYAYMQADPPARAEHDTTRASPASDC